VPGVIEGLTQALRYALPALALVGVMALAGGALVALPTRSWPVCERLAAAVVTATAVVVVASTWWAYRETANGPVALLLATLALVGVVVLVLGAWRSTQAAGGSRRGARTLLGRAGECIALASGAVAVGLVQYWPVLRSGALPGFVTAFTNPNNDIAIYVLQSDNVLKRGFGEYGRVAGFAIGSWTEGDHTGTSTFLATVARLFGVSTWEMAIPFMVFVIAATVLVLVALVRRAGRIGWVGVGAAALWALAAPFPSAVQSDYFLGQAMSRLLVLAQVLFVLQLLGRARVERPILPGALVGLTTSAGFLAYPAGEVSALALVLAVAGALTIAGWCCDRSPAARRQVVRRGLALVAAVGVGVVSVAPRWAMIVDTIRLYSNVDITGFPLPTARYRLLLGIGSSAASWSSWGAPLVVATFGLGAVGLVSVVRRDRRRATELLCLAVPRSPATWRWSRPRARRRTRRGSSSAPRSRS
jgi:hypothetical protein